MFEKLNNWIFARRLRRHPRMEAAFPRYTQIRSALIIYESDIMEKNPAIRAIRDTLLEQDIDVVTWGFIDKKEITSAILPQSRILGHNDITLFQEPKAELIADLQHRQYDLLIDLSQHSILPLQYLAMYARATFKTGMHTTEGIYHFIVDTTPQDDPTFLFNQILFYLQNISSND